MLQHGRLLLFLCARHHVAFKTDTRMTEKPLNSLSTFVQHVHGAKAEEEAVTALVSLS